MNTKQAGRPTGTGTDNAAGLVKRSKTALLAAHYRAEIQSGRLAPGDPLPSQREIEAQTGVSRITVRAALRELESEGLVAAIPGKGAFVSVQLRDEPPASTAQAAYQIHAVQGVEYENWPTVEDPATYHTNASAEIAAQFGIPEHTPLFGTDALLQNPINGDRIHVKSYLPFAAALELPQLAGDPFVSAAKVQHIARQSDLQLNTTHYITARNATPDDANTLRTPLNTALLVIRRITTYNGNPLIAEEITINPEKTPLRYDM